MNCILWLSSVVFIFYAFAGYIWSIKWTQGQLEEGTPFTKWAIFGWKENWKRRWPSLYSSHWWTWSPCNQKSIGKLCILSLENLIIYHKKIYDTGNSIQMTLFYFQVLYNILDWPTKPNSKLIVIGILLFPSLLIMCFPTITKLLLEEIFSFFDKI